MFWWVEHGGWNDHAEGAGSIRADRDPDVSLMPEDYQDFSLSVVAQRETHRIDPPLAVQIDGVHVRVRAVSPQGRDLAIIERFVPLPQHLAEAMP